MTKRKISFEEYGINRINQDNWLNHINCQVRSSPDLQEDFIKRRERTGEAFHRDVTVDKPSTQSSAWVTAHFK